MKVVYASVQSSEMDFGMTSNPSLLPKGAQVLAVCEGERTESSVDEPTFARMRTGEFYSYQSLVAQARRIEAERADRLKPRAGLLRRLFGR